MVIRGRHPWNPTPKRKQDRQRTYNVRRVDIQCEVCEGVA